MHKSGKRKTAVFRLPLLCIQNAVEAAAKRVVKPTAEREIPYLAALVFEK